MGGKKVRNPEIRKAFQACQDSFTVHPKLVRKLKVFYLSNDPDKFFDDFIHYLRFPISGFTERSVYVDRTLEFVAKFACGFLEKPEKPEDEEASKTNDDTEDEEEELPLFMYRLFAWLLDHHEVEGADARLRVCQLLNKLLKYMGEEACIDDDLYNKIYDGMLERLKDKVADIRSQAVTALQRLQDPKDEECPIIRAYLFHLAHDPNNVVRRTIVRCIGATRLTLPHILERTRDTDEHVRRAAYKFLAEKVHIKSLTIGQREGVLQRGLGERSEPVRKVVEKEMIPNWLRLSNNNIVQLLHHLDVSNSDQETKKGVKPAPIGALEVLFMDSSYRELVNNFQYLDTDKLIPYEKLTPETVMYWRVLAQFLDEQPTAQEYLEQILPELSPFCRYVRHYVLDTSRDDTEDVSWGFIAKELISIANIYDLGDEVGRQNLLALIKDMLLSNKIPISFIPALVTVFTKVEKDIKSRIDQVAEIISELKDPMAREEDVDTSGDMFAVKQPVALVDDGLVRAKLLDIAKLRVKMNEKKDLLDGAVTDKNFLEAQEIKSEMDQLEMEQIALEEQLVVLKGNERVVNVETVTPPPPEQDDVEDFVDNPAVTLKCLRLLVATLQDPAISSLNGTLQTLLEEFVTISVQSEIAGIRKEAILALACCCLRSHENARQHMLLLLQAAHIDVHEVRITAITAVVDLLMRHGLASFITGDLEDLNESGGGESSEGRASRVEDPSGEGGHGNIESCLESDMVTRGATLTQSELNTQGGNSVVAILSKILDEPDLDLRTEVAEGLCKLLMIGAINSPKLLSRLLLIWYNPMTESDSKLRHILGTFFPLYCSMSVQNQMAMEAAFLPTMKVLFDAPVTSPISEIDVDDVGMFFVHLTKEELLQSYDPASRREINILESSTTSVHDNVAMAVCNEILSAPDSFQTKVLIKVLTSLQLTHNNYVHLREVKVLAELLLRNVKERSCVRSLDKFDRTLTEWLAKDPGGNGTDTSGVSKRKSDSSLVSEESDKTIDVLMTPATSRKKRALFSTASEETALEEILEHESSDEEDDKTNKTVIPSPVVQGSVKKTTLALSTTSIDSTGEISKSMLASSTAVEVGDDTLAEREVTTRIEETDDEDNLTSALGDDEYIKPAANKKNKSSKGRGKKTNAKKAPVELEVLPVTDTEDEEDIFSDASSVASVNMSKLSKISTQDSSSGGSDEEVIVSAIPTPPQKGKRKVSNKKNVSGKTSQTRSGRSTASSSSSVVANSSYDSPPKTTRGSRGSRSNKTPPTPQTPATPPTVKKTSKEKATPVIDILTASPDTPTNKITSTRKKSANSLDDQTPSNEKTPTGKKSDINTETPTNEKTPTVKQSTRSPKTMTPTNVKGTPTSNKSNSPNTNTPNDKTTPTGLSRSGRRNSPMISYKTGAKLVQDTEEDKRTTTRKNRLSLSKKESDKTDDQEPPLTPNRKRGKEKKENVNDNSAESSNSSPVPKKKPEKTRKK